MGWLTRLLPHLDQDALWKITESAYEAAPRYPFKLPHLGIQTPVKTFGCPLDPRTATVQQTHRRLKVALSSYLGVMGVDYRTPDGVLDIDSHVKIVEIRDGASNTLIVGERPPSPDFWYGWWYAGAGQGGSGNADVILGVRDLHWRGANFTRQCPEGPYSFRAGSISEPCDVFHFWSPHSGGSNFAFADGSVRFLRYSSNAVLPALATRSGGESVEIP